MNTGCPVVNDRRCWDGHDGRVPPSRRPERGPVTRADLPDELTPETLRHIGFRTLRAFARRDNGVLDAREQQEFDAALAALRRGAASLVDESLRRAQRGEPGTLDPAMRRSYVRTQRLLAQQAERTRRRLPELAVEADTDAGPEVAPADDDVSPDALEQQVEQTSNTLDMLERIATLQQQLLDHQRSQLLSETRGFFFAFLVSLAVIVAGVAPLVEASAHDRLLIVIWTVAATGVAAVVYALVRRRQSKD